MFGSEIGFRLFPLCLVFLKASSTGMTGSSGIGNT